MPVLKNRRRELFAASVASGNSFKESAIAAGYSVARSQVTGSELNRKLSVRIQELREALALSVAKHTSYGLREAMVEASEALRMAESRKNASAMVAAICLKARLAGLLIERRQIDYRDVGELTDVELEILIASVEGSTDPDDVTH
jgi:hypothetical protein